MVLFMVEPRFAVIKTIRITDQPHNNCISFAAIGCNAFFGLNGHAFGDGGLRREIILTVIYCGNDAGAILHK